jgi:hypothetical protein
MLSSKSSVLFESSSLNTHTQVTLLPKIYRFVSSFGRLYKRRHDTNIVIHSKTTFKDIQTILDEVERGPWTLLATTFGPVPYWRVPASESLRIEANCQILYAIGRLEYVLAVVRALHSDYPIVLGEQPTFPLCLLHIHTLKTPGIFETYPKLSRSLLLS